jgi:hypothetical protein
MTIPAKLEFVFFQGATFEHTLQFAHGSEVAEAIAVGRNHAANIDISLCTSLAIYRWRFVLSFPLSGGLSVDLTVASAASIGDEAIAIQPYTGKTKLAYQSVATGQPENLTGQEWRGQIRPTASSTTVLATLPIVVTPADGLVAITIPATVTAALSPNAEYAEYESGSYGTAYVIDIESEIGGVVKKRAYGNAYVVREVTR